MSVESYLLRLDELFDRLVAEAESVEELSDGYALRYPYGDERRAEATEFGDVLHGFMAAAIVEVEDAMNNSTLKVRIRGPEALKDAIAKRMMKHRDLESRQSQKEKRKWQQQKNA